MRTFVERLEHKFFLSLHFAIFGLVFGLTIPTITAIMPKKYLFFRLPITMTLFSIFENAFKHLKNINSSN